MNNFVYQLKRFTRRLHVVLFIFWIIYEIAVTRLNLSEFSPTPAWALNEILESDNYFYGFAAVLGLIFSSYILIAFLLNSFIDKEKLLLEKLKIQNDEEMMQCKKEKESNPLLRILFAIGIVMFLLTVLFSD